ncbi:hypothetical protein [Streptomyces sp. NPDC001205]
MPQVHQARRNDVRELQNTLRVGYQDAARLLDERDEQRRQALIGVISANPGITTYAAAVQALDAYEDSEDYEPQFPYLNTDNCECPNDAIDCECGYSYVVDECDCGYTGDLGSGEHIYNCVC